MRHAAHHTFALLALGALSLPIVGCAAGDMVPDIGPGPLTTQSQTTDSGTTAGDGGTSPAPTLPPTPGAPTPSDDSGAAPVNDDAGATSDDSGQSVVDSAPPPVVDSGSTSSCPGYAPPTTAASCDCDPSLHTCAANGCYGGYYCKLSSDACEKKPSSC
jgi:hypothetical protein